MDLDIIEKKIEEICDNDEKNFARNLILYYKNNLAYRKNEKLGEYSFITDYVENESESQKGIMIIKVSEDCTLEKEVEKIKQNSKNINNIIFNVNLDSVNADKYMYPVRLVKIEGILKEIEKSLNINKDIESIFTKDYEVAKEVEEHRIELSDVVDIIIGVTEIANVLGVSIGRNGKIISICEDGSKTKEKEFTINQLEKVIKVLKTDNMEEKYKYIYEDVCEFLDEDFIGSNFCGFSNNKCIAQRKKQKYPVSKEDGCCFMVFRKCGKLKKENNVVTCQTSCLACKLFSCPYLTQRGITYYPKEILLLEKFLNKKQRHEMVFGFFKSKEEMIRRLVKNSEI